jgi:hypothetical protein
MKMITTVTGNTYPVRHVLKEMGFRWNPKFKSWDKNYNLSQDQINTLAAFRGIEVKTSDFDKGYSDSKLDTRSHKQIYGRCEDAPCCGCCGPQFY